MNVPNKKQPNKTYARPATVYSIIDALNYLVDECYRLGDVTSIVTLTKAINDIEVDNDLNQYDQEELDAIISLFRLILTMSNVEVQEFIVLANHRADNTCK